MYCNKRIIYKENKNINFFGKNGAELKKICYDIVVKLCSQRNVKVPMKRTVEERVKFKLLKFGRKNRFCSILVVPILAISMLFLRIPGYLKSNGKRFGMMAMSFFLFTIYSSFSFPMFVTGNQEKGFDYEYLEEVGASNVELAKEDEVNLDEVQILEDSDVLEDEEISKTFSHGMEIVDIYGADEILKYTEGNTKQNETDHTESDAILTHDTLQSENTNEIVTDEPKTEIVFDKNDWRLLLINKQNSVPDDYEPILGSIKTMKGMMKCDERIIDELLQMLADAKKDGVTLQICSPYRDFAYQTRLFNRKINRYMGMGMSYMEAYQLTSQAVTVPGASEHQIGLALDIVASNYVTLDDGFGETKAGKWLAANSSKYGFILRYPKGKEDITGIGYEPWHFRYVGVDAATIIMGEGITLEEFWEDYL